MTPEQAAVQASFAKVAPIAPQAAALFYGRLFEVAPEVRAPFSGDMTIQGEKLMATLAAAWAATYGALSGMMVAAAYPGSET